MNARGVGDWRRDVEELLTAQDGVLKCCFSTRPLKKVRGPIRRPTSRQAISFGDISEAVSAAVWASRIGADRIAAGGTDYFSGLDACGTRFVQELGRW